MVVSEADVTGSATWISIPDSVPCISTLHQRARNDLKRAFGGWIRQVLSRGRFPEAALERATELEEVRTMLEEQVQEWTRQWFEEGREQGRAEERALLCRLTARKFGTDTAERLSGVLNGLADPERLAEVGEWIAECETSAELLGRAGSIRHASDD